MPRGYGWCPFLFTYVIELRTSAIRISSGPLPYAATRCSFLALNPSAARFADADPEKAISNQ
jgi:hypothetical protein